MSKIVDARGDACPIPVIKTKAAIKEAAPKDVIEVLVDNEIAVQNVSKMAAQVGLAVTSEAKAANEYAITITLGDTVPNMSAAGGDTCGITGDTVVAITSNLMGNGNDELGAVLMKGFIYALTQLDQPPKTILFYNGGATLTTEGSESIADLKALEEAGVEILTCGTCLNYYNLSDKLVVGGVTNMYTIVEKLAAAGRIIRP